MVNKGFKNGTQSKVEFFSRHFQTENTIKILPSTHSDNRIKYSNGEIRSWISPISSQAKMPRNVEIKAKVDNFDQLRNLAKSISGSDGELIEQEDTFFLVPNGRLKLRELKGSPAQMIFYQRSDQTGPKLSDYHLCSVENPTDLKECLGRSLGLRGVVKKQRWLYMVDQTRIHCDLVNDLGSFMELEVVLSADQSVDEGEKIAHDLMSKLGVNGSNLIHGAYLDLIISKNPSRGEPCAS